MRKFLLTITLLGSFGAAGIAVAQSAPEKESASRGAQDGCVRATHMTSEQHPMRQPMHDTMTTQQRHAKNSMCVSQANDRDRTEVGIGGDGAVRTRDVERGIRPASKVHHLAVDENLVGLAERPAEDPILPAVPVTDGLRRRGVGKGRVENRGGVQRAWVW